MGTQVAAMRNPEAVDPPSLITAACDGSIGLFLREQCDLLEMDADSARRLAETLLEAATQCDGLKTEIVVCGRGKT